MQQSASNEAAFPRRGRPRVIPPLEQQLGKSLLQHILERMAHGESFGRIVAALPISYFTVRRYLIEQGYRIELGSRLIPIDPPDQGESGRRAG